MSERAHLSRSEMAKSVSRWKSAPSGGATTEQRRNLWTALNEFIRQNGGFVVSLQFTSPLRCEVPINSSLPARLRALGYDPIFCEQTTRIGPQPAFDTFDVFHLKLPK